MSHTVDDVRHRIKRLHEVEPNHGHFKMGDMDCEFMLESYDLLLAENAELKKEQDELRKELSSRPTEWAYEQVCKANEDKRVKLDAKDEEIKTLRDALEKIGMQGYWSKNTSPVMLLALLNEYCTTAREALQKPKAGGD